MAGKSKKKPRIKKISKTTAICPRCKNEMYLNIYGEWVCPVCGFKENLINLGYFTK